MRVGNALVLSRPRARYTPFTRALLHTAYSRATCVPRRLYVPSNARVLIIRPAWSQLILEGHKTVEVRGMPTDHRGLVWVSESGSRFLQGVFELWACEGPLSQKRWEQLRSQHLVSGERAYGASTYAWFLRRARRLSYPVPCARSTQVTWVRYRALGDARWRAV